jgi:hypothetical protein
LAHALDVEPSPPIVDRNVSAIGPPKFCKLLLEGSDPQSSLLVLHTRNQNADPPHRTGLLRPRRQRPSRRRTAEKRDEIASSHFATNG